MIGGGHTERLAVAASGVHCAGLMQMGTMAEEKGDSTRLCQTLWWHLLDTD